MRKTFLVTFTAIALLTLGGCGGGESPSSQVSNSLHHQVAKIPDDMSEMTLSNDGKFAYIADIILGTKLRIINVTNPSSLKEVASIQLPNSPEVKEMALSPDGNYLYIAIEEERLGLLVIDVKDPDKPKQVAEWKSEYGYSNHAISITLSKNGKIAYFADSLDGFTIIDTSTPSQPTELSHIHGNNISHLSDLVLSPDGKMIHAASTGTGLLSINVENPYAPYVTNGSLTYKGVKIDLSSDGKTLYLAKGNKQNEKFQIINISNPASPSLLGEVGLKNRHGPVSIKDLVISKDGTLAFLAAGSGDLKIVNISSSKNPIQHSFVDNDSDAERVELSKDGKILYFWNTLEAKLNIMKLN